MYQQIQDDFQADTQKLKELHKSIEHAEKICQQLLCYDERQNGQLLQKPTTLDGGSNMEPVHAA